ncbi:MAG: N-acetylmuramoyl-L-alanine amidase [Myxococcales bacterium]|nr:N-acetylmuramoyl-L-alanine amidase [Myxococcales bacterium]
MIPSHRRPGLLALALLLAACADPSLPAPPTEDHGHGLDLDAPALAARFAVGPARFDAGRTFRHAGLMLTGPADGLTARLVDATGHVGPAAPVELTWSEGPAHVGRVLAPAGATSLILEGGAGLRFLHLEFFDALPPARPLARDLPRATGGLGVLRQGMAPRDLVIPREEWGARNPDLICNDVDSPYRISVHHTASPDSDGGDPARTVRQIQAFHIDSRGWCDIGYHFVVSQSGLVFEGRRDERRPAAHVANQNSGNVGICFIGNYEVAEVPDAQFAAGAAIMGWVRRTYGIPADRDVIRGHQEWPGQQTACPGGNLLRRLGELIALSDGGDVEPPPPPPPPPPPGDVAIHFAATWTDAADFHRQGSSAGVPDAFAGERLEAVFELGNESPGAIRGVRLGYRFDPGLTPVGYTIETDWPARDRQTWVVNDADAAPDNPARDALGPDGSLTMYAFGAGETKRVRVQLAVDAYAGRYRPQAAGFVRHIDDVYDQADADAEPGLNATGQRLAEALPLDALARDQWRFPAPEPADLEGFTTCALPLTGDGGALVIPADGCALSPAWTQVDADRYDTLVLHLLRASPTARVALWWRADGEAFSADRALTFQVDGPGPWQIPLDAAPTWRGLVTGLRLTLDGPALALDHLHPQSRARAEGGTIDGFVDAPLATLLTDEAPPATPDGGPGVDTDAYVPPPRRRDAGVGDDDAATGADAGDPAADTSGDDGGCQSSPGHGGAAWAALLLALALRRRRRPV